MQSQNILDFWDNEKNEIKNPLITNLKSGKYFLKCNDNPDHSWPSTFPNFGYALKKGTLKCPFCINRKVSKDNNLEVNFPEIAQEWHPTKNGDLKPNQVVHGSKKHVWWLCPLGHEYNAQINERTRRDKSGCPKCNKTISKPQIRIYCELLKIFKNTFLNYKYNPKEHKRDVDIFLKDILVGIEYDGLIFHKQKIKKDMQN